MNEDKCQIYRDNAPKNLLLCCHISLNMLEAEKQKRPVSCVKKGPAIDITGPFYTLRE
jgi:hypothetical protein